MISAYFHFKDLDICLLELTEETDIIETGRINNVLLKTICLPENESPPGSKCFTSGIKRDSKVVEAVPLQLFNYTVCDENIHYKDVETTLNQNQLCAGLSSNVNYTIQLTRQYDEDFGGPLICLDEDLKPVFTGIASSNTLLADSNQPGIYTNVFKNKGWIQNMTGPINI